MGLDGGVHDLLHPQPIAEARRQWQVMQDGVYEEPVSHRLPAEHLELALEGIACSTPA